MLLCLPAFSFSFGLVLSQIAKKVIGGFLPKKLGLQTCARVAAAYEGERKDGHLHAIVLQPAMKLSIFIGFIL